MDVGEDVKTPFAASFPLPFRVLCLAGIGILGWATNLHGLNLFGVDYISTLELRLNEESRSWPSLPNRQPDIVHRWPERYVSVYRLFRSYSLWCLLAWAFYRYATHGRLENVDPFRPIAAVCGLGVIIALVCPFDVFEKHERDAFYLAIRRCLFPPSNGPIYFSDVVFADICTSYAKVLGDVWLSICMLLPGNSLLVLPSQGGWPRWMVPLIVSFPYLIRLRQCIIEHKHPSNTGSKHLMNALKYATSFPVIFLSAAQRIVVKELIKEQGRAVAKRTWHGEHPLFRLWLLAATTNSLYSFWWDVTNDWGLDFLKSSPSKTRPAKPSTPATPPHTRPPSPSNQENPFVRQTYPYGLRPKLLYPLPTYPMIIFLNFILRMTWSVKLSSHLHSNFEGGQVIFWLEVAEILRRWLWVFIRVEWEVVRKSQEEGIRTRDEFEMLGSDHDSVGSFHE